MACPDRYDLQITDAAGVSHGLVCDWAKGGAGLTVKRGTDLSNSTAASTKGDFGVRDVNDHQRIIQTDWCEGQGQATYDRQADSESAFDSSYLVDIDHEGELRLGPHVQLQSDADRADGFTTLPVLVALGTENTKPMFWGAFSGAGGRVRRSADGLTWQAGSALPPANVTWMTQSGDYLWAVANGSVYRGTASGFAGSSNASNANITHCVYNAGYLYATKGTASTAAQIGVFDSGTWLGNSPATGTAAWTAISPPNGSAINMTGATFSLVSCGNYVYWGVTNGNVTKVYKVMYSTISTNLTFTCIASFPTGFVGLCMHAADELNTVYVGGRWVRTSDSVGMGCIYALVNDQPALLTDVIGDVESDWGVVAMTTYERDLFFAAKNDVWRWDLVHGGYSHYAGPIAPTLTPIADITWDATWDMATAPVGVSTTIVGKASPTITYGLDSGDTTLCTMTVTDSPSSVACTVAASSLDNAVGTTMEVDIPAYGVFDWNSLYFGFNDGGHYPVVALYSSVGSSYLAGQFYSAVSGVPFTDATVIKTFSLPSDVAHTLRIGAEGNYGWLVVDDVLVASGALAPIADVTKRIVYGAWSQGRGGGTSRIDRIRYTNDGAFSTNPGATPTLSSASLATHGDKLICAATGLGHLIVTKDQHNATGDLENAPYLLSSRSAGNMPTVPKFFSAVHVSHDFLPTGTSIAMDVILDGRTVPGLVKDTSLSTDELTVFPIGLEGRNLQWRLYPATTNEDFTPKVKEVAVLFDPTPRTDKLYTYYVRCWREVQDRAGYDWDEDAPTVADWLEELANTVVTVERPGGTSFSGRVDALDYLEAPPSEKAGGREGLYQLTIRRLS